MTIPSPSGHYALANRGSYAVITFFGDLDAAMTETIRPAFHAQISPTSRHLVIDMSKTTFLDSHGVGFFVSLLKKAHAAGGQLFLCGADGQPLSVLKMVGLNNTLVTYAETCESALAAITRLEEERAAPKRDTRST